MQPGTLDRIVAGLGAIEDRRTEIGAEAKILYAEARDAGLNVPMVRQMVREKRMEEDARRTLYALQSQYRGELGLFADTPLGAATVEREAATTATSNGRSARKPKPFAEQPIRRRGRPLKTGPASVDDALDRARSHLGDPQGSA